MENSEPVLMSKNAYAKYLGVDEKAIRNAIGAGKIVKGWDAEKKKIIREKADKEFGFLHKLPKAKAGVNKAKTVAKIDEQLKAKPARKSKAKSEPANTNSEHAENSDKSDSESPNTNDLKEFEGMSIAEVMRRTVIHPDLSYAETERRKSILQLCTDRIKLEELHGSLVRKEAIDKALYAYGSQIKRGFLAIPARTIDAILAADTKVEAINILTEEINSALEKLSSYQNLKLMDNG